MLFATTKIQLGLFCLEEDVNYYFSCLAPFIPIHLKQPSFFEFKFYPYLEILCLYLKRTSVVIIKTGPRKFIYNMLIVNILSTHCTFCP